MSGKYDGYVKFLEKAEEDGFYEWSAYACAPWERLPFNNNSALSPHSFAVGFVKNIPEEVPLEYSDIIPGMVFREKDCPEWRYPDRVSPNSITIDNIILNYEELSRDYEWCIGGASVWNHCMKEPE